MCWTICQKKAPRVRIAKDDIKVYKILMVQKCDNDLCKYVAPYYEKFCYEIGKVYSADKIEVIYNEDEGFPCYFIEYGFHSYSPDCNVDIFHSFFYGVYNKTIRIYPRKSVKEGLDYWRDSLAKEFGIFEATIPAGSRYYINPNGEMVSNCLRVDKLVSLLKDVKATSVITPFKDYF